MESRRSVESVDVCDMKVPPGDGCHRDGLMYLLIVDPSSAFYVFSRAAAQGQFLSAHFNNPTPVALCQSRPRQQSAI
jgi:hypothetical protein